MTVITATCPNCHAQYQLQPEQLTVAAGKVRCGQCMTVFQASPAPVVSKPAAPTVSPTAKPRSSFVNDADEKLLASFDDELISDSEEELHSKKKEEKIEFSAEFDQALRESGLMDDSEVVESLENDESWAEQLLEEDDEPVPVKVKKSGKTSKVEDDPFALDLADLDISLELTEDEEDALSSMTGKDELRGRIQSEPLEFVLAGRGSLWVNIGLGVTAAFALLILIGQLFYFQFEQLARKSEWRGMYAVACQYLDCQLPEPYQVSAIQESLLTVKTHPKMRNALLVDAVITNQAERDQPFPDFELFFTNTSGHIVAAKRFKPEEYLRGELRDAHFMPSRQPVHIVIELEEPSQLVTGYWMRLSY